MAGPQLASYIPPEQIRMVVALIRSSGVCQGTISRNSEHAAKAYDTLCPGLPGRLTAPTVSRMATGNVLKKLKRNNLRLLHLTVHYVKTSKQGASAVSLQAVEAANSFAEAVLAAGTVPGGQEASFYNPDDPRHDRIAGLFHEYGVSLLEYAISREDANSFRKLAVLQWLSGNTDDARYRSHCASEAAPDLAKAINSGIAAREAFAVGRWYLYNGRPEVTEIYLSLAAGAGHTDTAWLLADVLEALQRNEEARYWLSIAQSNGQSGANMQPSVLEGDTGRRF